MSTRISKHHASKVIHVLLLHPLHYFEKHLTLRSIQVRHYYKDQCLPANLAISLPLTPILLTMSKWCDHATIYAFTINR